MGASLLDVLDPATQSLVRRSAIRRRFGRREVVFHEGDPGEALHLVMRGSFEVSVGGGVGERVTIRLLRTGDHFGELALIGDHRRRTATVMALQPSDTLMLSRDTLDQLRRTSPAIDTLLMLALAQRVEEMTTQLAEMIFLPVDKRVFRKIVLLDRRRQALREGDALRMSQADLAQMVGATRPTVNKVLQKAVERDAIELGRGRLTVNDRGALERWGR